MKKFISVISAVIILTMSFTMIAHGSDEYEMPKIPIGGTTTQADPCKDGHTPAESVRENVVPARCLTDGSYDEVVYCSVCGEEISREPVTLTALGHEFGEWKQAKADVAPTCTTAGSTAVETRMCIRNDKFELRGGDEIPALNHSFTNYVSDNNATCTEDGTKTAKCDRCDETDTVVDEGTKLGHDYVPTVTPPTETQSGYTTYTCSRCGDSYVDDYVDPTGHTGGETVYENVVNPTCTEGGSYDEVIYCTECNTELYRNTVTTEPLGHDLGEWTETAKAAEATCTTAGATAKEARACSRCDYKETRGGDEIPALEHDYFTVVTEPTCTEQGYTTHICTRGDDSYKDSYVDELGHNFVAGTVIAPTATKGGYTIYTCSRCDATENRDETPALTPDGPSEQQEDNSSATLPTADTEYEASGLPFETESTAPTENGNTTNQNSQTTAAGEKISVELCSVSGIKNKAYTGKKLTQSITLAYGGKKLALNTDYTVAYKNNKNPGTATVIITGAGSYTGSVAYQFRIIPKKTSVSRVTAKGSRQLKLSWKKQTKQTTGYQLQLSTDKKFKKNKMTVLIKKNKTSSYTVKGLKANKRYYVRIRTYKTVKGVRIYSSWSKAKKAMTKK